MDVARDRTHALARLSPGECLAAISASWPYASTEERRAFGLILTQKLSATEPRPILPWRRAGVTARHVELRMHACRLLALGWNAFDTDVRRLAIIAGRGCWDRALEEIDEQRLVDAGVDVARLALDSGSPAFTSLLPPVLARGNTGAVKLAAQALLARTISVCEGADLSLTGLPEDSPALARPLDPEPEDWTPQDVRDLCRAVGQAVDLIDTHHRKEVLLAALLMMGGPRRRPSATEPLVEVLASSDAEGLTRLASAVRRGRAPLARQRAWVWLRDPAFEASGIERLARAPSSLDHAVVAVSGHLALAPRRERALASVALATTPAPGKTGAMRVHANGPVPDQAGLSDLDTGARRRVPALVAGMGGGSARLDVALDPFIVETDPLSRFNAARVCSRDMLVDFAFDPDRAIAAHATLRWSGTGTQESQRVRASTPARIRTAQQLVRSPLSTIRRLGREERDRLVPGATSPPSRVAARRLFASDRRAFERWMESELERGGARAVGALLTCRRIGAAKSVEPALIKLVRFASDTKIAATAVACLGDAGSSAGVSMLRASLGDHVDPRVRSNAAEALTRLSRGRADVNGVALRAIDDPHHRVRGSGIRAAVQIEPTGTGDIRATDTLAAMLGDSDPAQRLAGLWVVSRSLNLGPSAGTRWERILARVRWLADEDREEPIRRRAGQAIRKIDAARFGLRPTSQTDTGALA